MKPILFWLSIPLVCLLFLGCPDVPTLPQKSSTKAITAFGFTTPAATGVINEANRTIAVTVPFGTDTSALIPSITHTGASISPASGTARNFATPQSYAVTAEDGSSQNYTVTVTVVPNSAKAITAFSFANPAATGIINETNHTIAVTVPFGTDANGLIPSITYAGASVTPASGVSQNFSTPQTYTVTAADGTTQSYVVTVTVNGQGGITIANPSALTVTLSGGSAVLSSSGSMTLTATASQAGCTWAWYLDGTKMAVTQSSTTIYGANLAANKAHSIMVTAKYGESIASASHYFAVQ